MRESISTVHTESILGKFQQIKSSSGSQSLAGRQDFPERTHLLGEEWKKKTIIPSGGRSMNSLELISHQRIKSHKNKRPIKDTSKSQTMSFSLIKLFAKKFFNRNSVVQKFPNTTVFYPTQKTRTKLKAESESKECVNTARFRAPALFGKDLCYPTLHVATEETHI